MRKRASVLFVCGAALIFPVLPVSADDSYLQISRSKAIDNSVSNQANQEKMRQEIEQMTRPDPQPEQNRAAQKQNKENLIASQFAGLSQELSQMPELPSFKGQLQSAAINQRPKTEDSQRPSTTD